LQLKFNNQIFKSNNGLLDYLQKDIEDECLYPCVYYKSDELEFTFSHTHNYGESYFSFVNGQYTNSGGTHQSAFREGILKGINEYFKKNYNSADIRDGIVGAVSVKLMEPIFESQTKNKLGNNDIRGWIVNDVKSGLIDYLHKNSDVADIVEKKVQQNEKLRKELNSVQKEARAAAKRVSIKIPNLKDCKYHLGDAKHGDNSMIFITEGASAAGSMVAKRNAFTQAIFALKGKPQNVFGRNRTMLYKNAELYNLMKTLGVEESIDNLRYGKIIIATDADVDGFHIRNLLMTFFLSYFENLVTDGRVFMLETPLFRVRNKKVTQYCYSEKEKDKALKKISGAEITRFKGLGEISPGEFGQFIGEDMKLIRVGIDELHTVSKTLEFYMGKNTPERRQYIMENLI
ncbi:MAG: type IIA DNA topoisomerase subunit B, partial [Candidatus Marinimicrobia bacterium]|nr:type IIA DNA topoisomerase subunit B [Candidatus Neomarinimicrobiota bacterium]